MQSQNPPFDAIRPRLSRWRLLLFLPFIIGIYFIIRSIVNDGSSTYAQPDAIFYTSNNRTIIATVVTYESGVSDGFAYKGAKYAEAIDLESGKRLWRVELDAKDNRDRNFGDAVLLGQSPKYLFFWRNELYVIDKRTGDVVARNNYFADVRDKMSREQITSYGDDRIKFTYNDSLQVVLFKGNDGLFYSINGLTLKTGVLNVNVPDSYFKRSSNANYDKLIAIAWDNGKQCLALLDDNEAATLKTNNSVEEAYQRSTGKSVRRFISSHASNELSEAWRKINATAYIYGGFLTDPQQLYQQPADSLAGSELINY